MWMIIISCSYQSRANPIQEAEMNKSAYLSKATNNDLQIRFIHNSLPRIKIPCSKPNAWNQKYGSLKRFKRLPKQVPNWKNKVHSFPKLFQCSKEPKKRLSITDYQSWRNSFQTKRIHFIPRIFNIIKWTSSSWISTMPLIFPPLHSWGLQLQNLWSRVPPGESILSYRSFCNQINHGLIFWKNPNSNRCFSQCLNSMDITLSW